MSKESDQALTMLVTVAGIAATLQREKCFAKVSLQRTIDQMVETASLAVQRWPIMCNMLVVKEKRQAFMVYLDSITKLDYPAVELVKMCETLVLDLLDFYPFGTRNRLVSPLLTQVQILADHVDAAGADFIAYDESKTITDELYRLLGISERNYA